MSVRERRGGMVINRPGVWLYEVTVVWIVLLWVRAYTVLVAGVVPRSTTEQRNAISSHLFCWVSIKSSFGMTQPSAVLKF